MNVFHQLNEPGSGPFEAAVEGPVRALLQRAENLGLWSEQDGFPRRWSLAELKLDEEDFVWLCKWAAHIGGDIVARQLRSTYISFEVKGTIFVIAKG